MLQGGACYAHRSTGIIVRACHLDGEGFRTLLGAAGGHLSPSWVDLGEAVVGFVGKYLGTADCEVARNRPTQRFNGSKVSGCTTRTKCLVPCVLRSFRCDVWASSVQRTVSRETAELHAAAQVSLAIPRHVRRYGASKGVPVGLSGGRCRLDTAYLCHSARFPPPPLSVCMTSTEHPPQ